MSPASTSVTDDATAPCGAIEPHTAEASIRRGGGGGGGGGVTAWSVTLRVSAPRSAASGRACCRSQATAPLSSHQVHRGRRRVPLGEEGRGIGWGLGGAAGLCGGEHGDAPPPVPAVDSFPEPPPPKGYPTPSRHEYSSPPMCRLPGRPRVLHERV